MTQADGEPTPKTITINRKAFTGLAVVAVLALAGTAIALPIALGTLEKGSGVVVTPACLASGRINFTYSVANNGDTSISQVTVTDVGVACSADIVSLKILNSSGTTVDEIIWRPVISNGDTSITLRANGSTTATSNSSSGGIYTSWPDSQAAPEGLQSIASTSVETATLSLLGASRAATN
jgi:hypothetical protein